jgi:Zn-dependent peptidase ImmA (M78 family)
MKVLSPEKQAKELREKAGVRSVPVSVEKIAKFLGIEIRYVSLDDELSGMVFIKDKTVFVAVNALHHPNRQRFSIAHEIGHAIMHKSMLEGKVHVDKGIKVLMRSGISSAGTVNEEIQANRFAAELLMPKEAILEILKDKIIDIDDDEPVEDLARKFKVSKRAMEHRISNILE